MTSTDEPIGGEALKDKWRMWDDEPAYGELFLRRATGSEPEMESSKAVAKLIKNWVQQGDRILDVGCGAGHYLRSLRNQIAVPFHYSGVDATAHYVNLAKTAWANDGAADFQVGDAFARPVKDKSVDIAMCCNVFLHLPSIKQPLRELLRVARRRVMVRTLIGDRSFRIQDVYNPLTHPTRFESAHDLEFGDAGEPKAFHYYNIYSKVFIENLLRNEPGVKSVIVVPDRDFDPAKLSADAESRADVPDITRMMNGWQVNGYILQPWHFIQIELNG